MPIGRLIRPEGVPMESGLVLLVRPPAVPEGKTMRCVERDDCATPGRAGLRPAPLRGITIGCVVAAPAGIPEVGIKPEGWGGLTTGAAGAADPGGVCNLGGVGGAFATGAAASGGFLSFLPKKKAIVVGTCLESLSSLADGALLSFTCNSKYRPDESSE